MKFNTTFSYRRTGIGDVILLKPEGHPYTSSLSLPVGYDVGAWYATDPLASVRETAKWTHYDANGTIPAGATKVLINVITAPVQTPQGANVRFTVSSNNYKAAELQRQSKSGASNSALAASSQGQFFPKQEAAVLWYDFNDLTTLWQNTNFTSQVTTNGQAIRSMTNKGGAAGQDLSEAAGAAGTIIYTDTAGLNSNANGDFNGAGGLRQLQLDAAASYDSLANSSRAMLVVFRYDDVLGDTRVFDFGTGSGSYACQVEVDQPAHIVENQLRLFEGASDIAGGFEGAFLLYNNGDTNANAQQRSGGTGEKAGAAVATSARTDRTVSIGSKNTGIDILDGAVYEVACWEAMGALSVPSMAEMRAYAAARYAITF